MQLPFGQSAYSRADGRFPPVRLVNLFHEETPTTITGAALIPRPGLHDEYDLGADIRGLYRSDGVFDGDVFAVAGDALFRGETDIGAVEDDTFEVEWAYTVDGLFILSGGIVYQYDGSTLVATSFPDSAAVASICDLDNFLFAVRQDTGTVYFRVPGDTTWNALDFFSAEREPDPAVAVRALSDALYIFGTSTVEVYGITGDVESPVSRIDGLGMSRGVKDKNCIAKLDNTLFFVGENDVAYRISGTPVRVSDNGIEDALSKSGTASSFTYTVAGHEMWVIRLDDETIAHDASTGMWHNISWTVRYGAVGDEGSYVSSGAKVQTLRNQPHDNGVGFERVFTAIAAVESLGACDAIEVGLSPGTSEILSEPAILQMRWSNDQGRTWSDWKEATTGFAGQYRHRTRFRRPGGLIDRPGRMFEFRMTDPVSIRFSSVEMNPPLGGRSRA